MLVGFRLVEWRISTRRSVEYEGRVVAVRLAGWLSQRGGQAASITPRRMALRRGVFLMRASSEVTLASGSRIGSGCRETIIVSVSSVAHAAKPAPVKGADRTR